MTTSIPLLDLFSLLIETAEAPSHVAPLMVFELPAGAPAGTVADIVAAWRRAAPIPPFNYLPEFPRLGLPRWEVASEIDMRYHVRHFTLPAPGSMDQLRELIEVLHTDRLDRRRPLFQVWVIDGLERGRFAVYQKIHHAIIDGVSAIMRVIGSLSEAPSGKLLSPIHALQMGETKAPASVVLADRLALLGGAVMRQAIANKELVRKLLQQSAATFTAGGARDSGLFSAPATRMNTPFGIGRSLALFSRPLGAMRAVGKAFGGTLNDVAMAIIDDAVVHYLDERGELPVKRMVAGCPVSTREKGDTRAGTDATMIFVALGAPDATPAERLEQIIANTREAKAELRTLSKEAAKDYALLAIGLSEGIGAVGLRARSAPLANLGISNVPGPRMPLYLGRAKLQSVFPVSMLASGIGLNVTLTSTAEEMHFGAVAGAAVMPDLQQLEALCVKALAALHTAARSRRRQDAVGGSPPATPSRRRRPTRPARRC